MLRLLSSYSSALRIATTPWLPSVDRTRWSSSVHSRGRTSKTLRVPHIRPSSSIGVHSAERNPEPFRSGAELLQRGRVLLAEPSSRDATEADGTEHAILAADRRQQLVHRARGRAWRHAAERPILGGRMAADHGLALSHAKHRAIDGSRRALAVDIDERVVGLEHGHPARVEMQDPPHALEHEVHDLLHGL